jgi:dihydrofolate synthase / folylpolyglutamate synthase
MISREASGQSSFEDSREFLYGLEKFGMKMDLDNITGLMEFAGRPDSRLKVIHVAGTNGKGSTCAALASVLMSAGYKVGLYTSPHMVSFTERIKINGRQISGDEVARLTDYFRDEIVRLRATFFEATTAIMFKYFSDNAVDYAVVETGLGGRLDSTNIVDPMMSVITGIGMDHTDILGDTLEKIAFEKAGIMKPGRPAVVNVFSTSLKFVFESAASRTGTKLFFVDEAASVENARVGIDSSWFDAVVFGGRFKDLSVDLGGNHQVTNALTALCALHVLEGLGVRIGRDAVYEGLSRIRANTGHHGRLEVLSRNPLIIIDVAHNPDGVRALLDALSPLASKKGPSLLFAAMKDKDAVSMLGILRERFSNVILTQLQTGRSLGVAELKKISLAVKLDTQVFENSTEALRAAINQTDNDSFLLITGSHYLAGEVLPVMEKSVIGHESL